MLKNFFVKLKLMMKFSFYSVLRNSIFIFINLQIIAAATKVKVKEHKYSLRICSSEGFQYETDSDKCHFGIWFEKAIYPKCICLNGLWILSNEICDSEFLILNAKDEQCFTPQKFIKNFAFIGHGHEKSKISYFSKWGIGYLFNDFQPKKTTKILRAWGDINLNFNFVVYSPEKRILKCNGEIVQNEFKNLTGNSENIDSYTIYIHKNDGELLKIKFGKKCFKSIKQEFKILNFTEIGPGNYKKVGHSSKFQKIEKKICDRVCDKKLNFTDTPASERVKRDSPAEKTSRTFPQILEEKEENLPKPKCDFPEVEILDKVQLSSWAQEKTLRNLKTELEYLLLGIQGPKIDLEEWKFMDKSGQIFEKMCPGISPEIGETALRFYRNLVAHTVDSVQYYDYFTDDEQQEQNKRIISALDFCYKKGSPFIFNIGVDKTKCKGLTNEKTGEKKSLKCEKCSEKIKNITFGTEFLSLHHASLPESQKFNTKRYGFIVEFIWKIINFAHFFCGDYFAHPTSEYDSNPYDLSAFLVKSELFFTKEILFRWHNPEPNYLKILEPIFQNENLEEISKKVDVCFGLSKNISSYPTWLSRPDLQLQIPTTATPNQIGEKRIKRSNEDGKFQRKKIKIPQFPSDYIPKYQLPICLSKDPSESIILQEQNKFHSQNQHHFKPCWL